MTHDGSPKESVAPSTSAMYPGGGDERMKAILITAMDRVLDSRLRKKCTLLQGV